MQWIVSLFARNSYPRKLQMLPLLLTRERTLQDGIGAEMQAGKGTTKKMHNSVVSSFAVAYLAANVYAIVKGGVFS
jgi:hypothetical protein